MVPCSGGGSAGSELGAGSSKPDPHQLCSVGLGLSPGTRAGEQELDTPGLGTAWRGVAAVGPEPPFGVCARAVKNTHVDLQEGFLPHF